MTILLAAAALVLAPPGIGDLGWLSGSWLSCRDGKEVSESWSHSRSQVMLGMSLTVGPGSSAWEQMRIAAAPDGSIFLHAAPQGQAEVRFRLVDAAGGQALFENPLHDFPQRVRYRRDGRRLVARIEGTSNGKVRQIEWIYEQAEFNARCPA